MTGSARLIQDVRRTLVADSDERSMVGEVGDFMAGCMIKRLCPGNDRHRVHWLRPAGSNAGLINVDTGIIQINIAFRSGIKLTNQLYI
jgi:hypothetical protein